MKSWTRSMNANATMKPTSSAPTACVMRLRSSSRCSRNVIRPSPAGSSSSPNGENPPGVAGRFSDSSSERFWLGKGTSANALT